MENKVIKKKYINLLKVQENKKNNRQQQLNAEMKTKKTLYTESDLSLEKKEISQKSKYLLPKLKSYSQNDVTTYTNLTAKKQPLSHYPFTLSKESTYDVNANKTQMSKISLIKYQYVNKSPNYFKKQHRSVHSGRFDESSYNQPIQNYLQIKMKQYDKKALLDLVNSRIKSVTNNHSKFATIQQQAINNQSQFSNTKLLKTKLNYQNFKTILSSQKLSNGNLSNYNNEKEVQKYQKETNASRFKTINGINKKNSDTLMIYEDQQKQKKKFRTLQKKNVQFYETKYSHFQPNKIQSVKKQIDKIQKQPSLKLNLYNIK